jgi:hypothetical protein
MKEESKDLVKWLRSMADSYSMPIDEFINDIQPYETLKQRYSLIYQAILNEVNTKDFDIIITHFKHLKDVCSTPQHDKDKTKAINQYHVEFIQNLINKLESYKSLNTNISTPPEGKKVPDRYYALLYQILVYLGKEPQIGNKTKAEIIDFGKQKYGTGQGFYREIRSIDLNNMTAFVRSLQKKDRGKWRETIITISGNDADVISWVNKQPK